MVDQKPLRDSRRPAFSTAIRPVVKAKTDPDVSIHAEKTVAQLQLNLEAAKAAIEKISKL